MTDEALACPSCGAAIAPDDRFCEACGRELTPTAVSTGSTAEPSPAAPAAPPAPRTDASAGEPGHRITTEPVAPACVACGAPSTEIQADGYCGVCGAKQPAPRDHLELVIDGRVAGVTDRGRRHPRNEDAFALRALPDGRIVATVCDGVSTTVDPDRASQAAVDAALAVLAGEAGDDTSLTAAHRAAVHAVLDLAYTPSPDLGPPSCTFLAATLDGAALELASLGDCRAVWLPVAGTDEILTEDDSLTAELVRSGLMTAEDAAADPRAHTITRWIGADGDPAWTPRLVQRTFDGAGRLVLCSDGLWNYAPTAADVAAAAATSGDPGAAVDLARRLVQYANDAGGHDNITVVVIDVPTRPDQTTGDEAA